MGRIIYIAVRNILEHRRRSLTLGLAIGGVTVLLVLLMGISNGMQSTMFRSATTLLSGHVTVGGFYKFTPSSAAPIVTRYKDVRKVVEENVEGIDYIIDRMRGWGKIISDHSSQYASVDGVDIIQEKGFGEVLKIAEGDISGLAEPNTILIFESHAKRLQVGVGDMLTISTPTFRGVNNTASVRIVAIAADIGILSGFMVYVPKATVRNLYQLSEETTGAVMVYLKDRRRAPEVLSQIRKAVAAAGYTIMPHEAKPFFMKFDTVKREDWTGQRIDVTTWEDEISFLSWTIASFDAISNVLVMVLLIIVVVGIMNALWMAIRERTGEIGTLRAIGMSRWKVLWMFNLEAVFLTVFSAAVGASIGWAIAAGINASDVEIGSQAVKMFLMSDTLFMELDLKSILSAVMTITIFNGLGALYPAWRAARVPPVVAMRAA